MVLFGLPVVFEADEKATELESQFGYECITISFEGVNE